jgi:hypothetical protein
LRFLDGIFLKCRAVLHELRDFREVSRREKFKIKVLKDSFDLARFVEIPGSKDETLHAERFGKSL